MVNSVSNSGGPRATGSQDTTQTTTNQSATTRFFQPETSSSTTQILRGQINQNRVVSVIPSTRDVGFAVVLTPSSVAQNLLTRLTS